MGKLARGSQKALTRESGRRAEYEELLRKGS